jgi:hypothetical protein
LRLACSSNGVVGQFLFGRSPSSADRCLQCAAQNKLPLEAFGRSEVEKFAILKNKGGSKYRGSTAYELSTANYEKSFTSA